MTIFLRSIIFIGIVVLSSHCQSATAFDQLLVASPETELAVSRPRHAVNLNHVSVNLDLLNRMSAGDDFDLQIYDKEYLATVEAIRPQVKGRSIRGRFRDLPGSLFTVTVVDDVVAGTFFVPGAVGMVRLRYGGRSGLHYLHQIVSGPRDRCAVKHTHQPRRNKPLPKPNLADDRVGSTEGSCGPTDTTFDVMIVYSADARAEAGGTAAIQAESINAVEVMQLTYHTCFVLIQTNIVSLTEVNYDETDRSYQDHLDSLIDPEDGILDSIHAVRDSVEADFVSLLVADNESGGLGRCDSDEDDAMSVCRWAQAADTFTLAHEIGHNIGCGHDPVNSENCGYDIGWAHFFFVPTENAWRHTVMSYAQNGSTRIPYYSSPACQYEGVPTGTSTRDNLAVILARQYVCEDFRRTRMDVWVEFGFAGSENGSFENPFNTVFDGVIRILPNPVSDIPVLHIKAGSQNESLTIDKPMLIKACGGTVTIGG